MDDLTDTLDPLAVAERWMDDGRAVAVATVVETWGSAPRPAGSHLVTPDGLRAAVESAGFAVEHWNDLTDQATAVMQALLAQPANPLGLHMRPAAAFATVARQFRCTVSVWRADQRVDGKSLFDLLLLAAEAGTELVVEVDGDDAAEALPALADILAAGSADDDPGPPPKG